MSVSAPAARRAGTSRPITPIAIEEDSMTGDIEKLLPPAEPAGTRWFDLCFRLIILTLAALWLLMPPAGGAHVATDAKVIATTR